MKMGGMCLNWKVLAGLAGVGLAVWAVAPNLVGIALPLLLVAACPLSMLLMGRGMAGGQCATQPAPTAQPVGTTRSVDLRLTREEQLAELKAHLTILQTRQQAIAREIAELGPPDTAPDTAAVREAEAVARAADQRVHPGA